MFVANSNATSGQTTMQSTRVLDKAMPSSACDYSSLQERGPGCYWVLVGTEQLRGHQWTTVLSSVHYGRGVICPTLPGSQVCVAAICHLMEMVCESLRKPRRHTQLREQVAQTLQHVLLLVASSPAIDTSWEVPSNQMAEEACFPVVLCDMLAPAESRL